MAIRRLLLPTNGSARSLPAAGFLVRFLAGRPPAEVHVLHVHSPVMGTRGMGPVKSHMLGSVATKVPHLADVPVELVK